MHCMKVGADVLVVHIRSCGLSGTPPYKSFLLQVTLEHTQLDAHVIANMTVSGYASNSEVQYEVADFEVLFGIVGWVECIQGAGCPGPHGQPVHHPLFDAMRAMLDGTSRTGSSPHTQQHAPPCRQTSVHWLVPSCHAMERQEHFCSPLGMRTQTLLVLPGQRYNAAGCDKPLPSVHHELGTPIMSAEAICRYQSLLSAAAGCWVHHFPV